MREKEILSTFCKTVKRRGMRHGGKRIHTCHSSALIQSWWNVPRLARTLPPSQELYRRSVGFPGACSFTLCCGVGLGDGNESVESREKGREGEG